MQHFRRPNPVHAELIGISCKSLKSKEDAAHALDLACQVLAIPIREPPSGADEVTDAAAKVIGEVVAYLRRS